METKAVRKNRKGERLTPEQVRHLFDYREDGFLIRKYDMGPRSLAGTPVICRTNNGGRMFMHLGNFYYTSRTIWTWHNGEWPKHYIDHIDGNRKNDRIENLRDVTARVNAHNRAYKERQNKTGYPGVYAVRAGYFASIKVDGKAIHLGTFMTKEEAYASYVTAKKLLHDGYVSEEHMFQRLEKFAPLEERDELTGIGP